MVKTSLGSPGEAGIGLWGMTSLTEPATGRWAEGGRLGKVRCALETQEMSVLGGVLPSRTWVAYGTTQALLSHQAQQLDQHCDTVSGHQGHPTNIGEPNIGTTSVLGTPQSRGHSSWLLCLLPLCDCLHHPPQRAAFRLSWGRGTGFVSGATPGTAGMCVYPPCVLPWLTHSRPASCKPLLGVSACWWPALSSRRVCQEGERSAAASAFAHCHPSQGKAANPTELRGGGGGWTLVEGSMLKHPTSEASGMTVYWR